MQKAASVRWIDREDLPTFGQGVVAAGQLARPPQGFGHGGAKCCFRTPRPHLASGGGWRRTYVLIRPEDKALDKGSMRTRELVDWENQTNGPGKIPFPGYRILWMLTIFVDLTEGPPSRLVGNAAVVPRPADLFAAPKKGSRADLRDKVTKPRLAAWGSVP